MTELVFTLVAPEVSGINNCDGKGKIFRCSPVRWSIRLTTHGDRECFHSLLIYQSWAECNAPCMGITCTSMTISLLSLTIMRFAQRRLKRWNRNVSGLHVLPSVLKNRKRVDTGDCVVRSFQRAVWIDAARTAPQFLVDSWLPRARNTSNQLLGWPWQRQILSANSSDWCQTRGAQQRWERTLPLLLPF